MCEIACITQDEDVTLQDIITFIYDNFMSENKIVLLSNWQRVISMILDSEQPYPKSPQPPPPSPYPPNYQQAPAQGPPGQGFGYSQFALLPGEVILRKLKYSPTFSFKYKSDLYLTNKRVVKIRRMGGVVAKTRIMEDVPHEQIRDVATSVSPPNIGLLILGIFMCFMFVLQISSGEFDFMDTVGGGENLLCFVSLPIIGTVSIVLAFFFRLRFLVINGGIMIFVIPKGLSAAAISEFHDAIRMRQLELNIISE